MTRNDRLQAAQDYYRYKVLTSRGAGSATNGPLVDHEMLGYMGQLLEHIESLSFQTARAERHLDSLVKIGRALSKKKNFDVLLRSILLLSKAATGADAGSIYLIEDLTPEVKVLRFKYSHTHSKNLPYEERIMPLDTDSIAGYVAVTGTVLNYPDVYHLTSEDPVSFNSSFDRQYNYRTKSMLVVPMRNHFDRIIGVIQLINCKDVGGMAPGKSAFNIKLATNDDYNNKVVAFPPEYITLVETIAAQAAIALENARMIKQIERQFEQFVEASVQAIESRDPDTSGHSKNVAISCCEVAEEINRTTEGRFATISFSPAQINELRYAGLLHDFGKVYLAPDVFLKAKKLYPKDFEVLKLRLELLYRSIEVDGLRQAESQLLANPAPIQGLMPETLIPLPEAIAKQLESLRTIMDKVTSLNEPTVTDNDPAEVVAAIRSNNSHIRGLDLEGKELELLNDYEAKNLSIPRGTLTKEEKLLIETHVEHSFNFLAQIPWPEDLRNIPEIVSMHHEKLDGSGYGIHELPISDPDRISLQSRIMAIADIWDALITSDRPYKKAVPFDRCCMIVRDEATRGKLDADLVEILIRVKSRQRDLS